MFEQDNRDTELKVGVVGYSVKEFDEREAEDALETFFTEIEGKYIDSGDYDSIAVVAGAAAKGVSLIAYELAELRGWRTVGVAAAEIHEHEQFDVDELIISGDYFGDDSPEFIRLIDVFVRVGGGDQSMKEQEMAEDEDIPVFEYDL